MQYFDLKASRVSNIRFLSANKASFVIKSFLKIYLWELLLLLYVVKFGLKLFFALFTVEDHGVEVQRKLDHLLVLGGKTRVVLVKYLKIRLRTHIKL